MPSRAIIPAAGAHLRCVGATGAQLLPLRRLVRVCIHCLREGRPKCLFCSPSVVVVAVSLPTFVAHRRNPTSTQAYGDSLGRCQAVDSRCRYTENQTDWPRTEQRILPAELFRCTSQTCKGSYRKQHTELWIAYGPTGSPARNASAAASIPDLMQSGTPIPR